MMSKRTPATTAPASWRPSACALTQATDRARRSPLTASMPRRQVRTTHRRRVTAHR